MKDDRRALRAFRPDVLEILSLISTLIVVVAISWFDVPPFPWIAIVIAGIGASVVATLLRFRAERQQLVAAIPALAPETAVVQSAANVPVFVYPRFFLERTAAGLSFQRVGSPDETVLLPWSEIASVDATGTTRATVTIAFHDGRPVRLAIVQAGTAPASADEVQAWLRGEAPFPEPYAAARYLLPRTPGEPRP